MDMRKYKELGVTEFHNKDNGLWTRESIKNWELQSYITKIMGYGHEKV